LNLLIVRLGSAGDIVHALPVLASMRGEWPHARIDWLVERRHAQILELARGLDAMVTIATRRPAGRDGWIPTIARLRRRRYDVAIDLQGLMKSAVLARASRAPRVIGFASGQARERAASWCYTDRVDPGPAARHVIDRNLALAKQAGVAQPRREFALRVPQPSDGVTAILRSIAWPAVVLNPGAAWPNKRWPADRFAQLAKEISRVHGRRSIVLWGPGERPLAAEIVAGAAAAAVLAPPTSWHDVAALLARVGLVVSGDTAALHMAAALGTPVVGIFGPTHPARNGPWSPDDVTVSRSERCQCPHARRCRATEWCLAGVGVEEVRDAVTRRLVTAARAQTCP
jgi:lipopolysaccharide heptosyltransferase I